QHAVVRRRPPLQNGDVEAVFRVSPVGQGLEISARLRIGDPIGAERHLIEGEGRPGNACPSQRRHDRNPHANLLQPSSSGGAETRASPSLAGRLRLKPRRRKKVAFAPLQRPTIRAEIPRVESNFVKCVRRQGPADGAPTGLYLSPRVSYLTLLPVPDPLARRRCAPFLARPLFETEPV